ncbi:hypothetical protein FIBSPDRAFT_763981 [Athelia psychrophila]|uniref:DUF2470 domain-containing protein n=1 Tax=Athelia psychrophila TaxID=1759441 RepID=A0A167X148_9AGAM|nr:hypothetical protein FIBSPDRAFT_763981 [Fibularhizoctonia sp. CBS 109695]
MSDPVAAKSGFLKTYMSSHPDTLVAYARYFGKVTENISSAEMTAIDTKARPFPDMTLTCTIKGSSQKKVVVVEIDPPLSGYEEVKPRLLSMKADAQEGLGMIKAPRITDFRLAPGSFRPIGLYAMLAYLSYPNYSPSPLMTPSRVINTFVGGWSTVRYGVLALVVIHILESFYTLSLCIKAKTGFKVGSLYILNTLVSGLYAWKDLRKRIQAARIESVMKVQ